MTFGPLASCGWSYCWQHHMFSSYQRESPKGTGMAWLLRISQCRSHHPLEAAAAAVTQCSHTRAMIDVKLRMSERSEGDQQLLYLLRGMMEWCIYPPQVRGFPTRSGAPFKGTQQHCFSVGMSALLCWCAFAMQVPSKLRGRKELVSWSCTEQAMMQLIKSRDPTGTFKVPLPCK